MVDTHGVPEPRSSEPGAHTLLRTIVGQQVSVAAARSMWSKLEAAYGSPPDLDAAARRERRGTARRRHFAPEGGLCAQPGRAGDVGRARPRALPADDEEAIALLTKIKGIGRWSAEIYLLFAEGRPDVWPAGDLAVQIEIGRLLGLPTSRARSAARAGRSVAAVSRRRRRSRLAQLQQRVVH